MSLVPQEKFADIMIFKIFILTPGRHTRRITHTLMIFTGVFTGESPFDGNKD